MDNAGLTRRSFIKEIMGGTTNLLMIFQLALSKEALGLNVESLLLDKGQFKVNHRWTDSDATIGIESFKNELKILHLADSHITVSDETDLPFLKYSKRMDDAYKVTKNYETQKITTPLESFQNAIKLAQIEKVDMIILTGDIVNNPSKTSVAAVSEELKNVGIPYVYIAGNHDWHYEGMEGSAEELRETWRKKRLHPLYQTESLSHFAVIKNGINFIVIDNSTYQVNEQQLKFFKQQINLGLPSVLLMHIPLSLTSFPLMLCGHPDWGSKTDRGYKVERRQKWSEEGNMNSTMEFVKAVSLSNNLVAILCGHTHQPRTHRVVPLAFQETVSPSAMQYVVRAGAVGGYRLVNFEGL